MGILASLSLLPVLAYTAYALLAVCAAWQWHRAKRPVPKDWTPPVTIFKPVCGIDAEAEENFASFCRLDYPAENLQLLFGVLDPADPALALARKIQTDYPHLHIDIVTPASFIPQGHNLKICNLLAMLPAAKHDLFVLCDSDMRVQPDYLRRITAPFAPDHHTENSVSKKAVSGKRKPRKKRPVGLVTCPYRGKNPQSFAAILEALGIGADFMPSVLVSRALEGVSFAFGSTIALPRSVLEEIGGFEALRDQLADDFRLGNGAHKAGYEVVLSDYVLDNLLGAETFGAMWARRLRWARTTRSCRPAGYAGSVVTHGLIFALLFLFAAHFSPLGWAVLAAVLLLRLTAASLTATAFTRDPNVVRFLFLLPVSDLLNFALFVLSFCGNRLVWRGERFRLMTGGVLARWDETTR